MKGIPEGMQRVLLTAVTAGLVFAAFAPVLDAFFDPQDFISFLVPLQDGTGFFRYMTDSWSWFENGDRIGFFRPVTSLSFLLDYNLWGGNPVGYRAVNMLLHVVCSLLVMKLSRAVGAGRAGSVAAGMLFAVHPGTQNAVTLIVARHDVLATLFALLALISTLRSLEPGRLFSLRSLLLPVAFTALSLGSKELGMASLVVVPLVFVLYPSGPGRLVGRRWLLPAGIAATLLAYILVRMAIFGDMGGYSSITAPGEMPSHALTMLLQSTGYAYVDDPAPGIVWLVLIAAMALVYVRLDRVRWSKVAVLAAVLGLFGFQAVAGAPCAHYVYAPAAVLCAMLGLFSSGMKGAGRLAVIPVAVLFLAVPAGVALSHEEGRVYNDLNRPMENVFRALEGSAEIFEPGGRYAVYAPQDGTPEELELKNAPLYLAWLLPGEDVTVRVSRDGVTEPGETLLVWEDGGIRPR
jgi:hypothetical protein